MIDFLYAIDPKDVARVIYPTVNMPLHPLLAPLSIMRKRKVILSTQTNYEQ